MSQRTPRFHRRIGKLFQPNCVRRVLYKKTSMPFGEESNDYSQDYDVAAMEHEPTPLPQLGLKRVAPYWTPLRTMAKGRWINREILEMVSTEFRDRSIEYYVGSPYLSA